MYLITKLQQQHGSLRAFVKRGWGDVSDGVWRDIAWVVQKLDENEQVRAAQVRNIVGVDAHRSGATVIAYLRTDPNDLTSDNLGALPQVETPYDEPSNAIPEDLSEITTDMREQVIDDLIDTYMPPKTYADQWDGEGFQKAVAE